MEEQHSSQPVDLGQMVIALELDGPERENDPALVLSVGNTTVTDVLEGQYTLHQEYTGQKGGFFIQFVTTIVQYVLDNRLEIIADLSGLVTIFGGVLPIVQKIRKAHRKHVGNEESERNPVKIEVEIDGAPIRIEASDLAEAEGALKLAQRFHSMYPDAKPTSQSQVAIRGKVPPRKRPARR